ncbi:MAG: hypothetical protein M1812_007415 [Candelaria pacifica]|nr:MAG: hypothetical protein M1812_007415 [Candelaria pacifica]
MLASYKILLQLVLVTTLAKAQQTAPPPARDPRDLPVVDLGYTWQRASSYESDEKLFVFNNIRFGEPPVGDLRFAAPVEAQQNLTIQSGLDERICIQGFPTWTQLGATWLPLYLSGNTAGIDGFLANPPLLDPTKLPAMGPTETEDCLFLDVVVPQGIFENRTESGLAPVLVWIYGGGYAFGNKKANANPYGLIDRSGDGIVYVAINYRLGAFGWLGGSSLKDANAIPNAGLYDQRLALDWVQKYIHLFGGDASRVTVMGESAGGGSIMHHITAYGGSGAAAPFHQAIPQSAAWYPMTSDTQQENMTHQFLDAAGVTTIEEARKLPMETLRDASSLLIQEAEYGQYFFGPVVDGDYVPQLPGQLLLQGKFHKDVTLMIGHQSNEGLRYTSPFIQTEAAFTTLLRTAFPQITASDVTYLTQTLYPPTQPLPIRLPSLIYAPTRPTAASVFDRATLLTAESCFTCNTYYLSTAFSRQTYNYIFNVTGATLHGLDVPYTFFTTQTPNVKFENTAMDFQRYLTSFVINGKPEVDGLPQFGVYGDEGEVFSFTETEYEEVADETANGRCDWWQKAFYI